MSVSTGRYGMDFIDVCYQPAPALPVFPSFKPARQEPQNQLDRDILTVLRDEPEPVGVWTLINQVAELYAPKNRAERRAKRNEVLNRINPLVRGRLVRRMGRSYLTQG